MSDVTDTLGAFPNKHPAHGSGCWIGMHRSSPTVHVTDAAIAWLQAIEFPVDRILRLDSADDEHALMTFGDPQAGDYVIEKNGEDLLHISHGLASALGEAELDCLATADGPRIALFAWDSEQQPEGEIYESRE